MKVAVFSSLASSLINFRGRLIGALIAAGHDVVACAPDEDEETLRTLTVMGATFRRTPMERAGLNPFKDLRTFASYGRLLLQERPDLVIAYTQKPIIYGGLAARATGTQFFVIMSGLGYVFSEACADRGWLRRGVANLYRHAVRRARTIFVFNRDDADFMEGQGIVGPDAVIVQVPGSGVDLRHFQFRPMPDGPPTFLMIGRLMRDKGVQEFVQAAALVKKTVPEARFRLVGKPETDNPTGLSGKDVQQWVAQGVVEHVPETRDVRPHLADAHVFVLPSYYREGLPRTLLEALATGRPIITTDMPGCREPVVEGENGWIVPPRNAAALADTMLRSIECRARLKRMGCRAREIAEDRFDVTAVNRLMLKTMQLAAEVNDPAGMAASARVLAESA